jgi:GAF domain-containing protein
MNARAYGVDQGTAMARAVRTKQIVHIAHIKAEPRSYLDEPAAAVYLTHGVRTLLAVPLCQKNAALGVIVIYRQERRPFTEKQIELVQNFAAQTVIAIENARLLNELRESLQQQTATLEVLQVIASSPGELEPVFQPMLANAIKLCKASYGAMWLREGDAFRNAAFHGALPAEYIEIWRSAKVPMGSAVLFGPLAESRNPVQVADLRETRAYLDGHQLPVTAADVAGIRRMVGVPMIKNGGLIGAIVIYRQEVRPFSDKHIELVTSFANQAVIAIENTRLLNELREPLQQQTATSEVLQIISSSPGDLEPVFQAMLENATRVCDARFGNMFLVEDGAFRTVALHNAPAAFADALRRDPLLRPHPGTGLERVMATKKAVQTARRSGRAGLPFRPRSRRFP